MKLLVATGLYPPETGGPATYAKMIEDRLPERGIEIEVLPFSVVRSYPKIIRHGIYLWKVWRRASDADIVYALDPISVGLPAAMAASLRGKKFMLRLGGDYAWEQGRQRFGITDTLDDYTASPEQVSLTVRALARLQTWVAKKAVVVVAPSEYLKKVIVTWGVAPDRVRVIYSSLVPVDTTLGRDTVRHSLQVSGPVITTAGRLVPWKGMRMLIDIVQDLRDVYPDMTLLIIGDGPEESVLKAQIEKYGLKENVRLLGRLTRVESANVIAASDVFVLNTAYEGLSHQLLEVMDWGTPIVTTTAGGNVELLSDGVDALLVPFNDQYRLQTAITTVLTNPETGQRLTQFARARSKEFSEDRVIGELTTLVANVYEA